MRADEHWLIDLDGVVWLGDQPIPGSSDAVARIRAAGVTIAFFTNNSNPSRQMLTEKLAGFGIEAKPGDLLTSAMAAATLIEPTERVLVIGGPGIFEALAERHIDATAASEPSIGRFDVVVMGFDPEIELARLTVALRALKGGARLVATNADATYPTPYGPLPGTGAFVRGLEYAAGVEATVAGKPNDAAADLVKSRLGKVDFVIGDRPDTDGKLAERLGVPFGLVHSGVTTPGEAKDNTPGDSARTHEAADLRTLAEMLLS